MPTPIKRRWPTARTHMCRSACFGAVLVLFPYLVIWVVARVVCFPPLTIECSLPATIARMVSMLWPVGGLLTVREFELTLSYRSVVSARRQ